MAKKWANPLDRLLEGDQKARSVQETLKSLASQKPTENISETVPEKNRSNSALIEDIDVRKIIRWKYKDRPENELGDIKELAETFKSVGQQQPCIVRPSPEHPGKYELIVGERRWKAAELADIKLKAVVRDFDDKEAALIQAVENERREDLSEYAKGMSYADKIEKGILSQKDLIEILKISKQQVSRLLSFRKIPQPLFEAIHDFKKVSARTAEELSRLSAKGDNYLEILITLAPKISEGKLGANKIQQEVTKKLDKNLTKDQYNQKVTNKDGRHLFTWRHDNNGVPSIHFPKDIIQLLKNKAIDFDQITHDFKECLVKKLTDINS